MFSSVYENCPEFGVLGYKKCTSGGGKIVTKIEVHSTKYW
jgi:hypothetical protein